MQQSLRLRPIRWIPAPMAEENISVSIDQKIAAGLIDIVAGVRHALNALAKELKIAHQGRRRKNLKSRKAFQTEGAIRFAPWIGKKFEGPAASFLIGCEGARLGKGNHEDRDTAPVEFRFSFHHLAEVRLARQSGEVAEENQQRAIGNAFGEFHRLAAEVEHRQSIERDSFHRGRLQLYGWKFRRNKKRGAPT